MMPGMGSTMAGGGASGAAPGVEGAINSVPPPAPSAGGGGGDSCGCRSASYFRCG
jgi:hypothetical protein